MSARPKIILILLIVTIFASCKESSPVALDEYNPTIDSVLSQSLSLSQLQEDTLKRNFKKNEIVNFKSNPTLSNFVASSKYARFLELSKTTLVKDIYFK